MKFENKHYKQQHAAIAIVFRFQIPRTYHRQPRRPWRVQTGARMGPQQQASE